MAGKYKVDLSIEDSQYQVETALQAYDKIKGDVVAFNQVLGTQIVKSILPRLNSLMGRPGTISTLPPLLCTGNEQIKPFSIL